MGQLVPNLWYARVFYLRWYSGICKRNELFCYLLIVSIWAKIILEQSHFVLQIWRMIYGLLQSGLGTPLWSSFCFVGRNSTSRTILTKKLLRNVAPSSVNQRAFTSCSCVFKVNTLIGSNQGNFFENATACSKRTLKTTVATQL